MSVAVNKTITRDDITLRFNESDGTVVLSVKDVDVVEVVLHGFWNGDDDYYMENIERVMRLDYPYCPPGGFMLSSWRYVDIADPRLATLDAENGEYIRLWSQPLPEKAKDQ